MSDIEINKGQWKSLPEQARAAVISALKEQDVLKEGDRIVPNDSAERIEPNPKQRDDHPDHPDYCVEACWLAAEMTYRTCMAMGGMPQACEIAMDQTYSHCMKDCR